MELEEGGCEERKGLKTMEVKIDYQPTIGPCGNVVCFVCLSCLHALSVFMEEALCFLIL